MTLSSGTRLGPYEIVGALGSGGMGEVYRALDTRLGRDVAIKVLPEHLKESEAVRRRFEREAKTLSRLQHPNVCALFDVGAEDDVDFQVMELLDGETLAQRLGSGPLPLGEVVEIGGQIADGIGAAHQQGVVHRDLKPGNVMLTATGAKVLDFGLARRAVEVVDPDAPTGTAALTREGTTIGSLPYMAPEQVAGQELDARTDVWALGCVLYEMTTGRRPFRAETNGGLAAAILRDDPAPIDGGAGGEKRLEAVISRCMAKEPEGRFQTAREVRLALEAALSGRAPVEFVRRWRMPIAAVVLLALAVPAWLMVRGFGGNDRAELVTAADDARLPGATRSATDVRRLIVVMPLETLGREAQQDFTAGMTEELAARIGRIEGLSVISRNTARRYAEIAATAEQLAADGVDYVLEGSVQWAGEQVRVRPVLLRVDGDTRMWDGAYDRRIERAGDIFAIQTEIALEVSAQLGLFLSASASEGVPPTEILDAYYAYMRGLVAWAQPGYGDVPLAADMFDRAVTLDPDFFLAWGMLAEAHSFAFHFGDQSAERSAAAAAAAQKTRELGGDLPETHRALGYYANYVKRDSDEAITELKIAAAGLPEDADILNTMGFAYMVRGDFEEGIRLCERASRLDPQSSNRLYVMNIGISYLRQYERAMEVFDRILVLQPDHPLVKWARATDIASWKGYEAADNLVPVEGNELWASALAHRLGRYDEALELLDRLPDGEVWTNYYRPRDLLRAWVYRDMGDSEGAQPLYESARADLLQKLAATPQDDRLHSALGQAFAGLGIKEKAIEHGETGLELKPPEKNATNGIYRLEDLAKIYAQVDEPEAALDALEDLLQRPGIMSVHIMEAEGAYEPLRQLTRYQRMIQKYTAELEAAAKRR